MRPRPRLSPSVIGIALAASMLTTIGRSPAAQGGAVVAIDADDIGGVVTGPRGAEAGVWVIAQTSDLPTPFARIVVTDDDGRYVVPDLPPANYRVWTRGYGLVDSQAVAARPGARLNLTATATPNPHAAAQIYPAGYWYSLLQVPDQREFPGTGPQGNGISPNITSQAQWVRNLKTGACTSCHQLGTKGTREIPKSLGVFSSSTDAWSRRIQSGQAGAQMNGQFNQFGRQRMLAMFADWTDRIAAGEVPAAPPRPRGLERNVVITEWDWADPRVYTHDEVSTDRRNPRVNANGLIYGSLELSGDFLPVFDPSHNAVSRIPLTVRDPRTSPAASPMMPQPSPYWGDEVIWNSRVNVHNAMFDAEGRLWLTSTIRPSANPAYCMDGSIPSSKQIPLARSGRQLAFYDPKTKRETHIDTCFNTHHLMFAEDANNTLWTSSGGGSDGGGGSVIGWLNTKLYLETHDEKRSQGWAPFVLDTNGNGKRDDYVDADKPVDPSKDKRINVGLYAAAPAPDGSVWGTVLGFPGAIVRFVPGSNPVETALAEYYELPMPGQAFSPRGGDVDRNGVYWTGLASGHMASFDRRKCKVLTGPTATGQHCPEGWTFYAEPLPQFKGVTDSGSVEGSYFTWVDQFDTLGLGPNTPIDTGNASEALLALRNGQWVVMRVPYPNGYFVKWMDGRIDDPAAGWKGRGIYSSISTRAPFHMETGPGTTSKVVRFQMRPDPLAH